MVAAVWNLSKGPNVDHEDEFQFTYPYLEPSCVRYGLMILVVSFSEAIVIGSSSPSTTNSNLHNLSAPVPNLPHTEGRLSLQMNRKLLGKYRSYTSSGV